MTREAFFLLLWGIGSTTALAVYDCNDQNATIARVDLTDTGGCAIQKSLYSSPQSRRAQIVQVSVNRPVPVTRCRVTETRTITRCGYDSITYGTNTVMWMEAQPVPADDCRGAAATGFLKFRGENYEVGPDRLQTDTLYLNGGLTADDTCVTETWEQYGRTWSSSYQYAVRDIRVDEVMASYNEDSRTLKLPSGLVLNATEAKGHAMDATEGSLVWSLDTDECRRANTEIFHGRVLVQEKEARSTSGPPDFTGPQGDTDGAGDLEGALVLAHNPEKTTAIGLRIKGAARTCGRQCYNTQLEGVAVCFLKDLDERLPLLKEEYHKGAEAVNRNGQLAYLHLTTNAKVERWFAQLFKGLCEAERRDLQTRLLALAGGSPYMLMNEYGPGHRVVTAGTVAYVHKCTGKEATLRGTDKCYREIPVEVEGRASFVDPFTWNLQEFGTEQPCSPVTPVMWQIMGKWYCSEPQVRLCPEPVRLRPGQERLKPEDYAIGMAGGTFTKEDKERHRHYQRVVAARGPAAMEAARHAVANQDPTTRTAHGPTLGLGVNMATIKQHTAEYLTATFPTLKWLSWGALTLLVIGLLIFFRSSLLACLRCFTISKDHGVSAGALGCCCNMLLHEFCHDLRTDRKERRRQKFEREARDRQSNGAWTDRMPPPRSATHTERHSEPRRSLSRPVPAPRTARYEASPRATEGSQDSSGYLTLDLPEPTVITHGPSRRQPTGSNLRAMGNAHLLEPAAPTRRTAGPYPVHALADERARQGLADNAAATARGFQPARADGQAQPGSTDDTTAATAGFFSTGGHTRAMPDNATAAATGFFSTGGHTRAVPDNATAAATGFFSTGGHTRAVRTEPHSAGNQWIPMPEPGHAGEPTAPIPTESTDSNQPLSEETTESDERRGLNF